MRGIEKAGARLPGKAPAYVCVKDWEWGSVPYTTGGSMPIDTSCIHLQ